MHHAAWRAQRTIFEDFWLVLAPEKQKDGLVSGVDGAISAHFEQKFTRILMSSVVTLNHRSQESVTLPTPAVAEHISFFGWPALRLVT